MPIVLVHGVPETDAIWDDLRRHLGRDDVIALSPPGFGAPVPDAFSATSDAYVAWLATELAAIPAPIDLVGHDWGGGHVLRLVAAHPELVRSWATDIAGHFDPAYAWHERAQVWQAPGAGEESIAQRVALPLEQRAQQLVDLGMSTAVAARCAAAFGEEMGRCILALYRSAAQPKMAAWGANLANARTKPGLVLIATEDHNRGEVRSRRTAERVGAHVVVLEGLGHFWMSQDPQRGAEALSAFFATLADGEETPTDFG